MPMKLSASMLLTNRVFSIKFPKYVQNTEFTDNRTQLVQGYSAA